MYTLYNLWSNTNLYYNVIYLLIFIFSLGIFLNFYQMDLFTAFLWLSELVVIFISFLLVFYLNIQGGFNKINTNLYSFKNLSLVFCFILFTYFFNVFYSNELDSFSTLYFDNWYNSINNEVITDFFGLYVSYFLLNNFELYIVFLFLLVGSLICVNLNKISKTNKFNAYFDLLTVFDFFKDFVKFIFLRKQNLIDQENNIPSSRVFKKKIN